MSQLGASGRPILAKANFFVAFEHDNGDITYGLHYKLTEPYQNGGPFDGEMTGSAVNLKGVYDTDQEIVAANKDVCAAYIADRYGDPTFTSGDIRGAEVLPVPPRT